MADLVLIDGFWAHFGNYLKPSEDRVTDLESSLTFTDAPRIGV